MDRIARQILSNAVQQACEKFPDGDDVTISSCTAGKLAEYAAQLLILLEHQPRETDYVAH